MDVLIFVGGIIVLTLGADSFLRGIVGFRRGSSEAILALAGFSAVAFGTSLPDMVVNLDATQRNHASFALGNILGSSVNNIGLILAASALIAPLALRPKIYRALIPMAVFAALLVWLLAFNDHLLNKRDGIVLLAAGVIAYFISLVRAARAEPEVQKQFADAIPTHPALGRNILRAIIGMVALFFGARWCVQSAVNLSMAYKWNGYLVGLTLLAIGTSIPQLVGAMVAAKFNRGDLVVTGVLGSTVLNLLVLLGIVAIMRPVIVPPSALSLELPAVIAFLAILYPMMRGDSVVSRKEGGILLGAYVFFLAFQGWLVLNG